MKRPNKKHRLWLQELMSTKNDGRLSMMVAEMRGVASVSHTYGHYGSVRVRMLDGYTQFWRRCDYPYEGRTLWHVAAIESGRYWRRRKRR